VPAIVGHFFVDRIGHFKKERLLFGLKIRGKIIQKKRAWSSLENIPAL